MPDPPPRAPTFPAFIDQVEEVDDSEFVGRNPSPVPSTTLRSSPMPPGDSPTLYSEPANQSDMSFVTTPTPASPADTSASTSDAVPVVNLPVAHRKSVVRAVLLWRDPKVTVIYFGVAMVFFYLTVIRGQSVLSVFGMLFAVYQFIGAIAVQVNKRLGGKFDKHIARPPAGTPFLPQDVATRFTQVVVEEVNDVQDMLRNIIYCDTLEASLACLASGIVLYFLGEYFSFLSLLFVATLLLFSLPLAYEKNKKQVDDVLAKTSDTVSKQITIGQKLASEKTAELLDKAPPAARDFANRVGLTPQKKKAS